VTASDATGDAAGQGQDGEPPDLRPLTMIRRVVARRMTQAAQTIPAVTLHRDVAFARLLRERDELGAVSGRRPAIDAILAAIIGRVLVTHDLLNGSWVETPPAVQVHAARNVAVAVDTPMGLVAVMLGSADTRDVVDLDTQLGEMVARARAGRLLPTDVSGATFTISNLGGLGIDAFTPIITPPQAAVLGVGAARHDDERRTTLSLTFDHRIADGADAARFLADVVSRIEAGIPAS
jgi:pyruvate/2-oxoglutarate dehydrogenase complex dihydrolipoamide acyltransferase (E2) component